MMFIWVIILVAAAWLAWNYMKNNDIIPLGKKDSRSMAILKERFAKGEISEDEYEERRAILENDEF